MNNFPIKLHPTKAKMLNICLLWRSRVVVVVVVVVAVVAVVAVVVALQDQENKNRTKNCH